MAFIRTRIIKGRPYIYLEERWREGKKVRSRSTILGRGSNAQGDWHHAGDDRLDPIALQREYSARVTAQKVVTAEKAAAPANVATQTPSPNEGATENDRNGDNTGSE